jgi:hypothetical protein
MDLAIVGVVAEKDQASSNDSANMVVIHSYRRCIDSLLYMSDGNLGSCGTARQNNRGEFSAELKGGKE